MFKIAHDKNQIDKKQRSCLSKNDKQLQKLTTNIFTRFIL